MPSVINTKLQKHLLDNQKNLSDLHKEFLTIWNGGKVTEKGNTDEFNLITCIGNGSFGIVLLAEHIKDKNMYALKLIEKSVTVKKSQVVHVKNEIRVMHCSNSEFLIKLTHFFTDNVYLYLGMNFINGGEMFHHLQKLKRFSEELSKFYAGQIILAIEYLHSNGIVHRDIKPENILISSDGYLLLCDFGFCKKIDDNRTYTLCGTPDYIAPEIILNRGHGLSVDWWSIGILIYEMNAGNPPFVGQNQMKLYEKICNGKYRCPPYFSKYLQNLLAELIVVDKIMRLGCTKDGVTEIKAHQWFNGFDWGDLFLKKIKPIYVPEISCQSDLKHFEETKISKLRKCSENEYPCAFADFSTP